MEDALFTRSHTNVEWFSFVRVMRSRIVSCGLFQVVLRVPFQCKSETYLLELPTGRVNRYHLLFPSWREDFSLVVRETPLYLASGRPKVNINKDFHSLNRLSYFYGGHVSNDVIIVAIVRP